MMSAIRCGHFWEMFILALGEEERPLEIQKFGSLRLMTLVVSLMTLIKVSILQV